MTTCKDCNGTKLYIGAGLYQPEPCKACTKATKDTKHGYTEVYTLVAFLNSVGNCLYYDKYVDITYFRIGGHTTQYSGKISIGRAKALVAT